MNKRFDRVYFLKNWRPSSVGAENAKSIGLITIPKKKFVLWKKNRELILLNRDKKIHSYRTQSSNFVAIRARRWLGWTHIRAIPQSIFSISVSVLTFDSLLKSRTWTFSRHLNIVWKKKHSFRFIYSMNNMSKTITKNNICTIFNVKICLKERKKKTKLNSFFDIFTFVSLHKQLNGVVIPNSLSINSRTCSAFFCSADADVQPII
jgi:hypothetical protein